MRLIDADALTPCHYHFEDSLEFDAVPVETIENAPTIEIGRGAGAIETIYQTLLARWYHVYEQLPEKSGYYMCILKDSDGTVYKQREMYVKDHMDVKDGWYDGFTHEYGYEMLEDSVVLYWLQEPELPEDIMLS